MLVCAPRSPVPPGPNTAAHTAAKQARRTAVAIESLQTGKDLSIIADRDEDLRVCSHRGLQDAQRPGRVFVLF